MNTLYENLVKLVIIIILVFSVNEIGNYQLPILHELPYIGVHIQYIYEFIVMDLLLLLTIYLFLSVVYDCVKELWNR
ncbi:hypothetical protein [Radiobacillus sp. PE A8.2]|uniref:hypothetical protein n=1 Tax=Radiobacillus sp. PE A8.2 TaxID=3380349 RepID=UPI00388DBD7E